MDEITSLGHVVIAVEPVWSKDRKAIGAIYVQRHLNRLSGGLLLVS